MKKIIKLLIILISVIFVGNVYALSSFSVENISVDSKSSTITVEDPIITNNEITSNITFNQKDDYVTFNLTIMNHESEPYAIKSITDNNTNNKFDISYSYSNDYIKPNETAVVKMTFKYNDTVKNVDKVDISDLTVRLTLINEEGKTKGDDIINPTTHDNIFKYIMWLIIAFVGIVLSIIIVKNKKVRLGVMVLFISLLIVPFAIYANEEVELTIKFTNIELIGEYETYNISIDSGNGAPVQIRQITYGEKLGNLPANPTKDGYTFDKWVDEEGNEVKKDTVITKQISVIASYNLVTYNITYDLDEGSLPSGKSNPDKYTIESQNITLNNPEKQGYTFAGWFGTGINGQTTEVTIDHGSKGNRSYKAHYLAKDDTKYTVIHKFQKLSDGYDEETVEEHGTTGSTVTAPVQPRTGFVTPALQNVTIEADESASVTYVYDRETYAFSITDRTYVDNTSTIDGTYLYGTEITLKAQNRPGYTFTWSDGDTNLERTFTLENEKELTPVYTADTNTPYSVEHYKMDIGGQGYTIAETQNLSGTTDSPISPEVNTYEGFTSPAVQSTTIGGDGHTVVKYYYTRNQVTVTINNPENVVEGDLSGEYYYDEKITLTAKDIDGKTFSKWSNDETNNPITITIGTSDIEIGPIYNGDQVTVTFNTDGGSEVQAQTVTYGEKATRPDSNPTKEGYTFDNWYTDINYNTIFDFENTEITSDTTIYAKFIEDACRGFSTASWSTIKTKIDNDSNYYPVGCEKEVELDMDDDNTPESYTVRLTNTSTPEICNTTGYSQTACGIVIEFVDIVSMRVMSSTYSNSGGWIETEMVDYLNGEFYNKLPSDLRNIIIPTYPIVSGSGKEGGVAGAGSSANILNTDTSKNKLYLFSTLEVGASVSWDNKKNATTDTRTLDYYKNASPYYQSEPKRVKSKLSGISNSWWLRSSMADSDTAFCHINSSGTNGNGWGTIYSDGVAPAFRIGKSTYTVTYNANNGTVDNPTKEVIKDGTIGVLPTPIAPVGYRFVGWYSSLSFDDEINETYVIDKDITIYAKYALDSFPVVFSEPGECIFNGSSGVITGSNCSYANGERKYIDTGIQLYNSTNHNKDYEIGFTIVSYDYSENVKQATFMNTKLEGNSYPGLVFRKNNDGDKSLLDFSSRKTSSANERETFTYSDEIKVKIYRIYNEEDDVQEIFYSINDGEKVKLNDLSQFNPEFNLNVWFGAAPTDASASSVQRYLVGTMKDMYIKLGTYHEEGSNNYTVTLNPNGGSVSPTSITHEKNVAIGELPTPTAPVGKIFDGWYTGLTDGIKVTNTYIPSGNITIYARYTDLEYTVSFNTDGGSSVASQTITYGEKATRPSTDPTKTGYTFDDWYTTDQYTTKFDFTNTTITSDTVVHAKFTQIMVCTNNENITNLSTTACSNNENITVSDGIVCKRAIKLHEETCSQTNAYHYCSGAGYTTNGSKGTSTITYGSCGTSGVLNSGDAFTCDVNGDGTFNEVEERFYYVSDYYDTFANEYDSSTAVLLYYNNVSHGFACNKYNYAYDIEETNYNGPRALKSQLPTNNQWSNVILKNTSRQILSETGSASTNYNDLPIFDYSSYSARIITYQELQSACGSDISRYANGIFDVCNYIMENTKYAKPSLSSEGYWMETSLSNHNALPWAAQFANRRAVGNIANSTSSYSVRPVIEVPKTKISY